MDNNEKTNTPHPLVQEAVGAMVMDPTEGIVLPAPGAEKLKKSLAQYFGRRDLRNAVVALVSLAARAFDHGGKKAAETLVKVCGTATEALRKLKEAGLAMQVSALEAGRKFAKFVGETSKAPNTIVNHTAPKASPPGTLRAHQLGAIHHRG